MLSGHRSGRGVLFEQLRSDRVEITAVLSSLLVDGRQLWRSLLILMFAALTMVIMMLLEQNLANGHHFRLRTQILAHVAHFSHTVVMMVLERGRVR